MKPNPLSSFLGLGTRLGCDLTICFTVEARPGWWCNPKRYTLFCLQVYCLSLSYHYNPEHTWMLKNLHPFHWFTPFSYYVHLWKSFTPQICVRIFTGGVHVHPSFHCVHSVSAMCMEDKQVCVYIHQTLVIIQEPEQWTDASTCKITVPQLSTCSSYMLSVHVYKSQSNEQMHASTSCTIAIYQYVTFHPRWPESGSRWQSTSSWKERHHHV